MGCIFMVYLNISEVQANCKTPGHNVWRALWSRNACRTLLASIIGGHYEELMLKKQDVISWYVLLYVFIRTQNSKLRILFNITMKIYKYSQ